MSVHTILRMGDPRLLRKAAPVTEFNTPALDALVADMFDTMHAASGAGLAAPQIGENTQLVIYGFKSNLRYPEAPPVPETVLINPVITAIAGDIDEQWEGCLSVPGMRGLVPRLSRIHYEGFDQFGARISRDADGFHARVVQHECDHLIGVLYPMRMRDFSQFGFTDILFPEINSEDD